MVQDICGNHLVSSQQRSVSSYCLVDILDVNQESSIFHVH